MAILLEYELQHGAQNPVTLQTQLPLSSTTSHRWVLDMLSKGKKLKPLVSEFKDYVFFLNAVNCDPEDSAFFQRQIQCGTIRVDEQVGGNVFYWSTSEKEYKLD
jgi:hypothetical protein